MHKTLILFSSLLFATQAVAVPSEQDVLNHYADIAHATYQDSLNTAKALAQSIDTLITEPTEKNLAAARAAWKQARVPYQQSEAFRFGNPIVDDWEGKVNSWPLDEGLIDYVAASYGGSSDENPYYAANVIANRKLMISGRSIDTSHIDKKLLAGTLQELDGIESNVATGYHAIEFLLWGQDLNGTGPGAGNRPASDYNPKNCSWGNCDRRADYLKSAIGLLVDDLEWMTRQWAGDGAARQALLNNPQQGIAVILTGMGSLSYGEMAGERMKLGLMLHDPEEEQDCFSDNTHNSHYYDALGIRNVYTGRYTRVDGRQLSGPSVSDLLVAKNSTVDKQLRTRLDDTLAKMQVLVDSAEKQGIAYDQLIAEGNLEGNAKVMAAVQALLTQTRAIEKAVNTLNLTPISFEGSDSLDAPGKVLR